MRTRWLVRVTLAESIGYLAPTIMGIFTVASGIDRYPQALLMAAAGCCEGLALGVGQASSFALPLHRLRYVALTALGAGLVWFAVMSMMAVFGDAALSRGELVLGLAVGAVALLAIGALQWLELRRHVAGAWRWIGWSALAWSIALPLSFAPSPLVDETTSIGAQLVLWTAGGVLMAFVMAAITWLGVVRLLRAHGRAGAHSSNRMRCGGVSTSSS